MSEITMNLEPLAVNTSGKNIFKFIEVRIFL